MGAIAIADALLPQGAAGNLRRALFLKDESEYVPGPTARAIADLKVEVGDKLRIYTTNYDDLIEQALEQHEEVQRQGLPVIPFVGDQAAAPDSRHLKVRHMHGYLCRDGTSAGSIVVTDREYWQLRGDDYPYGPFKTHLDESSCLFVGASLNDPNVARFLFRQIARHGATPIPPRHYVVFARQAERYDQPWIVREAREHAAKDRWASVGLEAIFVDHFVDVAQLLKEILHFRRTKATPGGYRPLNERMRSMIGRIERKVLRAYDEVDFQVTQRGVIDALTEGINAGRSALDERGSGIGDEVLAAALWLFDQEGRLKLWVSTERIHLRLGTLQTIDLDVHSRWVAVQTACRGISFGDARAFSESRWSFIRGIPLVISEPTEAGLPVGVLTVTTTTPTAKSAFAQLSQNMAELFARAVAESVEVYLKKRLRMNSDGHTLTEDGKDG